jgi:hypothetical protein
MITPSPPTGPALSPFNPIFYDDNDIPNLDLDDDVSARLGVELYGTKD